MNVKQKFSNILHSNHTPPIAYINILAFGHLRSTQISSNYVDTNTIQNSISNCDFKTNNTKCNIIRNKQET